MPLDQGATGMDLGKPVMEPDLEGVSGGGATHIADKTASMDTSTVKIPKGGEI